jgi:hypothetical protein
MKKLFILVSIMIFTISLSAQVVKISGTQVKGSAAKNAELKCNPVTITKTMTITKIEGDCEGFWIVKDSKIIHQFWDNTTPIGTKLAPGTYYIYPNLKPKKNTASVTASLQ